MVRLTVGQRKKQVSEWSDSLIGSAGSNSKRASYEQRENGPGRRNSKDRWKEDSAQRADSILPERKGRLLCVRDRVTVKGRTGDAGRDRVICP